MCFCWLATIASSGFGLAGVDRYIVVDHGGVRLGLGGWWSATVREGYSASVVLGNGGQIRNEEEDRSALREGMKVEGKGISDQPEGVSNTQVGRVPQSHVFRACLHVPTCSSLQSCVIC